MNISKACRVGIVWALCLQLLIAPLVGAIDLSEQIDDTAIPSDESAYEEADSGPVQSNDDFIVDSTTPEITTNTDEITDVTITLDVSSDNDVANASSMDDDAVEPSSAIVSEPGLHHPGIVITQLQTIGGTSRASEDLIEIRNNSDLDLDITDWTVRYASGTGSSWSLVAKLGPTDLAIGWRLILPAGATYLLGTQQLVDAHPGLTVDQKFNQGIANAQGRLVINDDTGEMQSGLAWGATALPVEGAAAVGMTAARGVIERKLRDDTWHQNTRDNSADFQASTLRDSYVTGQAEEVFDACLNIDGTQDDVPDGWYRDETTGRCSDDAPQLPNSCEGLVISEIGANLTEQFIEIHNDTDDVISLDSCQIATNRSATKYFQFPDEKLTADGYRAVMIPDEADLTLTKTTSGTVYLLSEDGRREVDSVSYANLRAGTSWALVGEAWYQTYVPTPGAVNVYEQFLPCDDGFVRNAETGRCNKAVVLAAVTECAPNQYRNPDTGRCRLIETASTLAPCREGQYRHPETNRCRNLATTASTLVPCREGQVRNPATNRCRNIASTAGTLQPCQEGWERNPDTNRCRKIQNLASIMDFPVEPIVDTGKGFAAWWTLGGVTLFGAGYGVWEWRRELASGLRRASGMMGK